MAWPRGFFWGRRAGGRRARGRRLAESHHPIAGLAPGLARASGGEGRRGGGENMALKYPGASSRHDYGAERGTRSSFWGPLPMCSPAWRAASKVPPPRHRPPPCSVGSPSRSLSGCCTPRRGVRGPGASRGGGVCAWGVAPGGTSVGASWDTSVGASPDTPMFWVSMGTCQGTQVPLSGADPPHPEAI